MTTSINRMMKNAAVGVSVLAMAATALAQDEIIYNNTTTRLDSVYNSNFEFGDEISFAGQNKEIVKIQVEYNAILVTPGGETGLLKIYGNDGAAGAPGTLIYSSNPFTLENGSKQVDIDTRSIKFAVPNTVTWTLSFSGLGAGESAGALLYSPPTVGTSASDFWQKDSLGAWNRTVLTPLPANFSARITAVPEPTTLQLGMMGALLLGGYSLRRRSAKS